jgi:hypothetical protein
MSQTHSGPDGGSTTNTPCWVKVFGIITHIGRAALDEATSTPRWVKVFGIIAILLVVLFVILHLTGLAPAGHGM